jgi:hypothetical protein
VVRGHRFVQSSGHFVHAVPGADRNAAVLGPVVYAARANVAPCGGLG